MVWSHSQSQPQQQPGPQARVHGGPVGEVKVAKRPKRGTAHISFGSSISPGLQVTQKLVWESGYPTNMPQHRALHGYRVLETKHHHQETIPGEVSCGGPRPVPGTDAYKTCLLHFSAQVKPREALVQSTKALVTNTSLLPPQHLRDGESFPKAAGQKQRGCTWWLVSRRTLQHQHQALPRCDLTPPLLPSTQKHRT